MRSMVSVCIANLVLLANVQAFCYANVADLEQDQAIQTLHGNLEYDSQHLQQQAVPDPNDNDAAAPKAIPAITELNFDTYIDVKTTKLDLHSSYLSSQFSAYHVSLTNNTPFDLQMIQANIINGYDGDTAYDIVQKKPFSVKRLRLSFSYVGIATRIIGTGFRIINNKKAKEESVIFNNEIPMQNLTQGQTIEFTALVPVGQKPKMFVKYYQPKIEKVYYSHLF